MARIARLAAYIGGGLLGLVLLVAGGLYGFSQPNLDREYLVDPAPLAVSVAGTNGEGVERIEQGERLVRTRGCMDCHAEDMGGKAVSNDFMVGTIWGSNLTRGEGGVGGEYRERDWLRAIRHGVGPDGKPLVFMPSHEFWVISDEDMAAMIAYLEAVPPVDRVVPRAKAGPIARLLYLTGKMPLVPAELVDHAAPRPEPPTAGATVEYGAYLASGCIGCHGNGMSGGPIPGAPPGFGVPGNITPDAETGLGSWSEADFVRAMREGISRDGRRLDPTMPVQFTREFTDLELSAMWKYLQSLEPRPFGKR